MQQRPFFIIIALLLSACNKHYYATNTTTFNNIVVNTQVPQDTVLKNMLAPYKLGVDTQMKIIIGYTDTILTKAQPECTLGNFMADAQLWKAKKIDPNVDISIFNYGGMRLNYITPGGIEKGTLYELMPFNNSIVIMEIPGTILLQFCNKMASAGGWPVSGIRYQIKDQYADSITVGKTPLDTNKRYKIVVSDYLSNGGDQCDFLREQKAHYTTIMVRDAMIEYVKELAASNKPLHPQLEKRVSHAR